MPQRQVGVESPGFQGSFGHFGMVFYSDSVLNGFLSQYVLSQAHPPYYVFILFVVCSVRGYDGMVACCLFLQRVLTCKPHCTRRLSASPDRVFGKLLCSLWLLRAGALGDHPKARGVLSVEMF